MCQPKDEVLQTGLEPLVQDLRGQTSNVRGPLDLPGITPHPLAPLHEHRVLAHELVGRHDRVPHLSVLGDQAEHDLLAGARDEYRHGARRPRLELFDAPFDPGHAPFDRPPAITRLAEPEPEPADAPPAPTPPRPH